MSTANTPGFAPIIRTVTGHDASGKAIVASHGPLPHVAEIAAIPGTVFHEVWCTQGSPVRVDNGADPTVGPLQLKPPAQGTRIRFVDIPPDTEAFLQQGAATMKSAFSQIGDTAASTVKTNSPHPLMHRTESVDYGVVIDSKRLEIDVAATARKRRGKVATATKTAGKRAPAKRRLAR